MTTVSVVIPNYNHARYLPRRVDSVLAQTYQDFEIIFLDDCSTDDSREVFQRLYGGNPRIRAVFNDVNSGSTFRQWNKGVDLARGQYIWLAESDDYADPTFLEQLTAKLDANPGVGVAYCQIWMVDQDDKPLNEPRYNWVELDRERWWSDYVAPGREELRFFATGNLISNASGAVFRKDVYQRVGGPDAGMRLCGDWMFWIRMLLASDAAFVAQPLNYWRCHARTVRADAQRLGIEDREAQQVLRFYAREMHQPLSKIRAAYHVRRTLQAIKDAKPDLARFHAWRSVLASPAGLYRWKLLLRALRQTSASPSSGGAP